MKTLNEKLYTKVEVAEMLKEMMKETHSYMESIFFKELEEYQSQETRTAAHHSAANIFNIIRGKLDKLINSKTEAA